MTESRVFTASAVMLLIITGACVATSQWLGVIGSLLGSVNALAARSFLLKLKPEAATQ